MTKRYTDSSLLYDKQQKALQKAREAINYIPVMPNSSTLIECYDRFLEYSAREANLIVKLLKEDASPSQNAEQPQEKHTKQYWQGYVE